MPVRLACAASILLLAAAGCAAGAPAPGPTPVVVPPPGEQARRLAVPFDAYNFSPAEIMTIESARELLIRDCMRGQGLAWDPLPRPAEDDVEPQNRRRYGVIEPDIARIFGFHAPFDRQSVARRDAQRAARSARLPPAARQAAYGEPADGSDGCSGRARAHLLKDAPKVDPALFNTLITRTFAQSRSDAGVRRAFRSWSACMKGEGFAYPDPLAAVTDERWLTAPVPSRQEIAAARADVACKRQGGLVAVWAAAEQPIQRAAIDAHPGYFRTLKARKDRQLQAAGRVLARG